MMIKPFLYLDPNATPETRRKKTVRAAEAGGIISLIALATLLPYADITAVRNIALGTGLLCWIVRMVALGRWDLVRTPLDLPLALFALVEVISFFTAPDPGLAIDHMRGETLKWILIYYMAVNTVRTEKRALAMVGGLLLGALVMDVYGIIEFFVQNKHLFGWIRYRLNSLHASAPQLGQYQLIVAPFIALAVFHVKTLRARIAFIAFLCIHILAMYMVESRTNFVAFFLQWALILYALGVPRRLLFLGLVACLAALIAFFPRPLVVFGPDAQKEYRIFGVGIPGIKGSRYIIWKTALDYLSEHPFSGIGAGRHTFTRQFPELTKINTEFWHAHNVFLSMAVGLGVQGLAVFLFLIWRTLRPLWPGPIRPPGGKVLGPTGWLRFGAVTMVAGFLFSNLTTDLFEDDTALLYWLLVGCAFSMLIFAGSKRPEPTPNRRR